MSLQPHNKQTPQMPIPKRITDPVLASPGEVYRAQVDGQTPRHQATGGDTCPHLYNGHLLTTCVPPYPHIQSHTFLP